MLKTNNNKLEAWSLIGRIGHQAADWNTVMTPEMLEKALRDNGVPREVIILMFKRDDWRGWNDGMKEHRDIVSRRACRIVHNILEELEVFPDMTILETMQFAQERKHALRSK